MAKKASKARTPPHRATKRAGSLRPKPPAAAERNVAEARAPSPSAENDTLVKLGERVRVERAYRPETEAGDPNRWLVGADGEAVYKWTVYRLVDSAAGKHPVSGEDTVLLDAWVKVSDHTSRDDAMKAALELPEAS